MVSRDPERVAVSGQRVPIAGRFFRAGDGQRPAPSRIIVGLGNPGREYALTRHNVGFRCVDRLAKLASIHISRRQRHAAVGEGTIEGVTVALAKPRTFVNDSGQAVTSLMTRYQVSPEGLVVVCDDMNLPLGVLRLRSAGGSGGHNGIKSIIQAIGTQDFPRIRIGIGRPPPGVGDVEYVLGAMPSQEWEAADEAIERAAQSVACILGQGMAEAMSRFN